MKSKKKIAAKKTVKKKTAVAKKPAPKKSLAKKSPAKKVVAVKKSVKKIIRKPAAVKVKSKAKQPKQVVAPPHAKKIPLSKRKMRYTSKELEHFKKILLEERNSILDSARANMKSLVDSESGEYVGDNSTYATHMAEQGTDEMEREKNYLFVQRDEKYLGYIQEALNRIDLGTYGVCIDCLEEPKLLCDTCPLIPKERLELVPITQHCLECKQLRG
jgi:RNA polymerase-binding transcription factor DksA